MPLRNTPHKYGTVSKTLHWCVVLLIIVLIWLGWYMVDLGYYDRWYNTALSAHKSFGMLALALAVINILWNLYSNPPKDEPTLRPWERIAAPLTHHLLYLMMITIPLTGYLISTSEGAPVSFFGWLDIPAIYVANESIRDLLIEIHYYAAYLTAIVACGHGTAAFKHHFIDRDATLRRML